MKTPDYLDSCMLPWHLWTYTKVHADTSLYECGAPGTTAYLRKAAFETRYPGFISAYDKLTALGCDSSFSTCVLKFCINHAQGESLDTFLERTNTVKAVETALAVGLSGEEFVTALQVEFLSGLGVSLPENMVFDPVFPHDN